MNFKHFILIVLMMISPAFAENGVHNHQRKDAISNTHAGRSFEDLAKTYFLTHENLPLEKFVKIPLSVNNKAFKDHNFDLGSLKDKILVECKSHRWTVSGEIGSKIPYWYQALYYFSIAPKEYQKILFVLEDRRKQSGETLAEYFMRLHSYAIPENTQIWEYNMNSQTVKKYKL
jgi:hypothetical protein